MNEFKSGVWSAILCFILGTIFITRAINEPGFYTIVAIPYFAALILFIKYIIGYKIIWDEEGLKYYPSGKIIYWSEVERIQLKENSKYGFRITKIYIRKEYKSKVKKRFGFYDWYFNNSTEISWLVYKKCETNHEKLTEYWNSISRE
ncbi:hypothetical protein [Neobacillus massiliamazoniensis]|uniref:Uncharacterized protein n=1 Tax=Neobacillus massiliamazoniensis TaxID=1499688 RepID=A0A0U1NU51_9BACI|nr:hypothetical protein [Neobacillus massiliamazoniensis]CRK81268.1 hypothetical protein BN000_01168 [Neobacillus massiliamazoniensis]